jgi:integrase
VDDPEIAEIGSGGPQDAVEPPEVGPKAGGADEPLAVIPGRYAGSALVAHPGPHGKTVVTPAEVAAEVGTAEAYREKAYAASTLRAYRSDWRDFVGYCADRGASPLPADPLVVRTYLAVAAERDGRKVATLQRRIAAIAYHHREAGHVLDTHDAALRATWRGIRRDVGVAQTRKAPAVTEAVKAMVAGLPDTLVGVRDRALLLLGFAGAFRRSELCALDVSDVVQWDADGVRVLVRRSKTDQEGQGRFKDVPYGRDPASCPVRALREWLDRAGIESGPVFRPLNKHGHVLPRRLTDQVVALAVKRAVAPVARARAEEDWSRLSTRAQARHDREVWLEERVAEAVRRYAGHSLRAGFVTSAAAAGARLDEIMDQTHQADVKTVMRYVRNARAIRLSAAAKLGL